MRGSNLDGTEHGLREQLEREPDDAGRAEVLTQLARVQGLRGDFDGCEELLAQAEELAEASDIANVRIKLEGGRKLRSSGEAPASVPLFEAAFEDALSADLYYLAGDAAHMVAIADPDKLIEWTERGPIAFAKEAVETAQQALGRSPAVVSKRSKPSSGNCSHVASERT